MKNIQDPAVLAANIKRYRGSLNYTQQKLSNLSGVKLTTLQKYERGIRTNPDFGNIYLLARALEVSTKDLYSAVKE